MTSANPPTPDPRNTGAAAPEQAALTGLVVNMTLAGFKLIAGIVGNSFALVADAVESMVDVAGSLIVWRALEYGNKPADEDHPFGHGKAESLAALAVGLLVVVAGIGIAIESIDGIRVPHRPPAWYTLLALIVVIVVKEFMFRFASRAAAPTESSAGRAEAWHHRSDALTSAAAFLGIAIALIGGERFAPADDWAALAASVIIFLNGVYLLRAPLGELMDKNTPAIATQCADVVLDVEGILAVERCEARKVGRTYRVIMHAEVPATMSVADAHSLTGHAKALVRERMPHVSSLLIHIEPHQTPDHDEAAT
ncbi:MAG TPA: cation diffusion facilitator family transporter [Phycisphaerae bacterium]|nr:cation diffusion facilitator family transporter [Phycisphaerae bacterium]HRW52877.1 cation diffusion facilitator family transporter [Phycisphaerae bacterium]